MVSRKRVCELVYCGIFLRVVTGGEEMLEKQTNVWYSQKSEVRRRETGDRRCFYSPNAERRTINAERKAGDRLQVTKEEGEGAGIGSGMCDLRF